MCHDSRVYYAIVDSNGKVEALVDLDVSAGHRWYAGRRARLVAIDPSRPVHIGESIDGSGALLIVDEPMTHDNKRV